CVLCGLLVSGFPVGVPDGLLVRRSGNPSGDLAEGHGNGDVYLALRARCTRVPIPAADPPVTSVTAKVIAAIAVTSRPSIQNRGSRNLPRTRARALGSSSAILVSSSAVASG